MIATEATPRVRTIPPAPGLYPGVPFAEYLKWDAISRSDLECASRSLAHLKHRLEAVPEAPTPSMVVGQALHLLLLEPDVFDGRVTLGPINERTEKCYGRTTKEWAKSEENAAKFGHLLLSECERADVEAWAGAASEHRAIRALSGKGETEVSAVWKDAETGVLCKARYDYLVRDPLVILDVKTCEDASPRTFQRNAQNYGYFFQLAHYSDGLNTLLGNTPDVYLFAIEKEAPHQCLNYTVQPDALGPASRDRRRLLVQYAKAKRLNEWPGYPEEADLFPPEWVFKQDQFEGVVT